MGKKTRHSHPLAQSQKQLSPVLQTRARKTLILLLIILALALVLAHTTLSTTVYPQNVLLGGGT